MARDYWSFASHRLFRRRPLMKDPFALCSAEWLGRRFEMDVVILTRHPAAFVGSIKSKSWNHPFEHFLEQPQLMERYLAEFHDEIREYARLRYATVDQGILLWNLIHHVILQLRAVHPEWLFKRHEDLSARPIEEFSDVYERLGLEFSRGVRRGIERSTGLEAGTGDVHPLRRHSRSNIWSWRNRLSAAEVERVREGTRDIAEQFYGEEDWIGPTGVGDP
jgi:hypothetical protein